MEKTKRIKEILKAHSWEIETFDDRIRAVDYTNFRKVAKEIASLDEWISVDEDEGILNPGNSWVLTKDGSIGLFQSGEYINKCYVSHYIKLGMPNPPNK